MDFSTYDPEKFLDVGDGYLLDLEAAKGDGFDNDTNSINDTGSESSDSADEENAEDTTVAAAGSIAEAHRAVNEKKQELLNSKVKHWIFTFSDGSAMTKVKDSIRALNSLMEGSMPKDKEGFTASLGQIRQGYRTMIECCQNYVTYIESKGKGQRRSGARRLELVKDILTQSRNELATFFERPSADLYKQNKKGGSWDDILYNARAEKINEGDSSVTKMGAGTSTIYRKENEDGSTSYIKEEEHLQKNNLWITYIDQYAASGLPGAAETAEVIRKAYTDDENYAGMDASDIAERDEVNKISEGFSDLGEMIIGYIDVRKKGESDKAYKARRKEGLAKKIDERLSSLMGDEFESIKDYVSGHKEEFVEMVVYVFKKRNEFEQATDNAKIDAGESISNRNVSTSRMAERYGIGDMIAGSKTILIEKDDGKVVKANSMEGVEGMDMAGFLDYASAEEYKVKYSANAMSQLMQLQIFDLICGQTDRHMGNYIPSYEMTGEKEFTVTSIKGIDNDMAFGSKLFDINGGERRRPLVDNSGKVTVPYLHRDFYDRIMSYTPEMAAFDQMDIRSRNELKALGIRITEMQNQLRQLVSEGRIKLLDSKKEWEEARKMMLEMNKKGLLGMGYLSAVLDS